MRFDSWFGFRSGVSYFPRSPDVNLGWGVVSLRGKDLLPGVSSYPDGSGFTTLPDTGLRGMISQAQGCLWLKKYRLSRLFVSGHVEVHVVPW